MKYLGNIILLIILITTPTTSFCAGRGGRSPEARHRQRFLESEEAGDVLVSNFYPNKKIFTNLYREKRGFDREGIFEPMPGRIDIIKRLNFLPNKKFKAGDLEEFIQQRTDGYDDLDSLDRNNLLSRLVEVTFAIAAKGISSTGIKYKGKLGPVSLIKGAASLAKRAVGIGVQTIDETWNFIEKAAPLVAMKGKYSNEAKGFRQLLLVTRNNKIQPNGKRGLSLTRLLNSKKKRQFTSLCKIYGAYIMQPSWRYLKFGMPAKPKQYRAKGYGSPGISAPSLPTTATTFKGKPALQNPHDSIKDAAKQLNASNVGPMTDRVILVITGGNPSGQATFKTSGLSGKTHNATMDFIKKLVELDGGQRTFVNQITRILQKAKHATVPLEQTIKSRLPWKHPERELLDIYEFYGIR